MAKLAEAPSIGARPLPPRTKSPFAFGSSLDEQYAEGKSLREKYPRKSHGEWKAPDGRPDPVSLMEQSNKGRIPELIPIRHGRMLKTPFTFYRGAALNMAADLAGTPATGLRVQACGDCHLSNFGAFATPERRVIFDINDLDETLPAPWEWDVKRLAASFVLACRSNGFSEDTARDTVLACVRSYRERMREFRKMRVLDVWYAHIDVEEVLEEFGNKEGRKRAKKQLAKARGRSVAEHDFPKLAQVVGQRPVIKDNPPLIFHWHKHEQEKCFAEAKAHFAEYRATLQDDRQRLLDHYEPRDVAVKVVGVGSVGTWCGILLLLASEQDPLFLRVKGARASVLEPFAGPSIYPNHGQRVVNGCRLIQAASDLFLGWVQGKGGAAPSLLCSSAQGHEDQRPRRGVQPQLHDPVRRDVRLDAGAGACPQRRAREDQRVPRQERPVRRGDRRLRRRLRGPGGARPHGVEEGRARWPAGREDPRGRLVAVVAVPELEVLEGVLADVLELLVAHLPDPLGQHAHDEPAGGHYLPLLDPGVSVDVVCAPAAV